MKIIIPQNQRGFLLKKGLFIKMLSEGEQNYRPFWKEEVILSEVKGQVAVEQIDSSILWSDPLFQESVKYIKVPEGHIALHSVNGKTIGCLQTGEYYFWNIYETNEFQLINTEATEEIVGVRRENIPLIPSYLYTSVEIQDGLVGVLYKDGAFQRELTSGAYYFWNINYNIIVEIVDMRSTLLQLTGQEILTADKVSLRINFICTYKIIDAVRILNTKQFYMDEIYNQAQLALREHVGRYRLDQLLEDKEKIGEEVLSYLQRNNQDGYVTFLSAGIKDIILPGEIQNIMNTVLVAEKTAQANVITRREEVASTRSLLNTARLMDENKTLYKLKELEYLERITEQVGTITLHGGSGDVLGQLGQLLVPKED